MSQKRNALKLAIRCRALGVWAVLATALLLSAQDRPWRQRVGLPQDWTHKHVVFSNPGSFAEAMKSGSFEKWYRVAGDIRFNLQQRKRNPPQQGALVRTTALQAAAQEAALQEAFEAVAAQKAPAQSQKTKTPSMHRDWSVTLNNGNVAATMSPAKYTFSPIGIPDCTNDYVVFPINIAGGAAQANLIGFNRLYSATTGTNFCTGAGTTGQGPSVTFAYNVGAGTVQTSPVLSLDGTKVAFVESKAASVFHVLTIGTNTGHEGTAAITPVVPGSGTVPNNSTAVDTKITMSGNVNVTRSSPFVNYAPGVDVAYVGDDAGKLHKFTGVFLGSLAEAGAPWPITVAAGVILTGPTFDSVSGNIFVGGSDGKLYYVRETGSTTGFCSGGGSPPCLGSIGSTGGPTSVILTNTGANPVGSPIVDPPLVDPSTGRVFAEAGFDGRQNFTCLTETGQNTGCAILAQTDTALGGAVFVNMGSSDSPQNAHIGALDNNYFNCAFGGSACNGFLYFGGYAIGSNDHKFHPTLYRVGFGNTGVVNSTHDANSLSLTPANPNSGADYSPLTEIFNTGTGKDWLFVSVASGNLMNFDITSTFPTVATATASETGGTSAIVIDNVFSQGTWQATHAYALNTLITDTNGNVQKVTATTTGTSGAVQPTWNTTTGGATPDGGVTWTNQGPDQTSSMYFGTLTGKTAVKLTQAGLQ